MTTEIAIELPVLCASPDDDELNALVKPNAKKPEGPIQRLVPWLIECASVKVLLRVWGPRLEFVVRLMLVATFFDDSFRVLMSFSQYTTGRSIIATVTLIIGLFAQIIGSLCILLSVQPNVATIALIAWVIAQPVLSGQFTNVEAVADSISLIGGLLLLRVHLVSNETKHGQGARTQLLGRLLLPAACLYQAGFILYTALTLEQTSNLTAFVSSLSMFVIITAGLVGLVIASSFVAVGLKSRTVALLLALVNLGLVFYQHPFFRYIWRENGEWKYSVLMPMPHITLPEGVSALDYELWQIYDLHKYYFFLGISTSGALLLLAQFGPGEISVQKDEVILPYEERAD